MYVISEDDVHTLKYLANESILTALTGMVQSATNEELQNLEFTNFITLAAAAKHNQEAIRQILASLEVVEPPKKTFMQKLRFKK